MQEFQGGEFGGSHSGQMNSNKTNLIFDIENKRQKI